MSTGDQKFKTMREAFRHHGLDTEGMSDEELDRPGSYRVSMHPVDPAKTRMRYETRQADSGGDEKS